MSAQTYMMMNHSQTLPAVMLYVCRNPKPRPIAVALNEPLELAHTPGVPQCTRRVGLM